MPRSPRVHSLAKSLAPLLKLRKADVTLGEMLDRVEDGDGPGSVLLILTLPVLLPLPPGLSMVLALPLLLVAPQIMIGRKHMWLPGWMLRRSIERDKLKALVRRALPPLRRMEGLVRPRLSFLTGRSGAALAGFGCTLLAIVLVLPIPFANLAPALAICAFALGLARRDGLFILAGYGLIIIAVGIIGAGAHGISLGIHKLETMI